VGQGELDERMKTPGSIAWRCIRARSPSSAPPLKGLERSTAITPTRRPCPHPSSASTRVDLPAPGGPVTPHVERRRDHRAARAEHAGEHLDPEPRC
jgi:hypothetical protein